MSSDSEPVQPTTQAFSKKQQRRQALERLKASKSSSSSANASRARPSFLGQDDDDDDDDDDPSGGGGALFDGLDALNRTANRLGQGDTNPRGKKRPANANPVSTADVPEGFGTAFDDLFDLSSDAPNLGRGGEGADVSGAADVEVAAKKRRVVAKMDDERLLSEVGFPKLRRELKKVKIKGKGHEMQDLRRVLTLYQLWTHEMYPRTNLKDTLQTVEKLCRKRNVQSALKQYRDLEKSSHLNGDDSSLNDPEKSMDQALFGDLSRKDSNAGPFGAPLAGGTAGKGKGTEKETKGEGARGQEGMEEDGHMDWMEEEEAILAELEREAMASGGGGGMGVGGSGSNSNSNSNPKAPPPPPPPQTKTEKRMVFEEEDGFGFEGGEEGDAEANAEEEAILAELEMEQERGREREAASTRTLRDTGDEKGKGKQPAAAAFEEDEDMFAAEEELMTHELEREAAAVATSSTAAVNKEKAEPEQTGEEAAGGPEGETEEEKALREAEELLGF
ncbi:hypothetical protein JCM11641_004045 [Rhodosporidiobolus odoratus]